MLQWELWRAVHKNEFEKMKLLVEHGVSVSQPTTRHNRTPHEGAVLMGNDDIAEYLLQHGATRIELDEIERFSSGCVAGRRSEAVELLQNNPRLIEQIGEQRRSEIVHEAAASGRSGALRLVAELGFDLNAIVLSRTAMHDAAWANRVDTIREAADYLRDWTGK
jgi:ankyrin repeat protein